MSFSRCSTSVDHSPEVSLALQGKLVRLLGGRAFVVLRLFLFDLITVSQRQPAVLVDLLRLLEVASDAEVVFLPARVRNRCIHLLYL